MKNLHSFQKQAISEPWKLILIHRSPQTQGITHQYLPTKAPGTHSFQVGGHCYLPVKALMTGMRLAQRLSLAHSKCLINDS